MIKRKWVVLFEHPYYPEIHLFDDRVTAYEKFDELKESNHVEDGHHEGYLYVGAMEGLFENIKTLY